MIKIAQMSTEDIFSPYCVSTTQQQTGTFSDNEEFDDDCEFDDDELEPFFIKQTLLRPKPVQLRSEKFEAELEASRLEKSKPSVEEEPEIDFVPSTKTWEQITETKSLFGTVVNISPMKKFVPRVLPTYELPIKKLPELTCAGNIKRNFETKERITTSLGVLGKKKERKEVILPICHQFEEHFQKLHQDVFDALNSGLLKLPKKQVPDSWEDIDFEKDLEFEKNNQKLQDAYNSKILERKEVFSTKTLEDRFVHIYKRDIPPISRMRDGKQVWLKNQTKLEEIVKRNDKGICLCTQSPETPCLLLNFATSDLEREWSKLKFYTTRAIRKTDSEIISFLKTISNTSTFKNVYEIRVECIRNEGSYQFSCTISFNEPKFIPQSMLDALNKKCPSVEMTSFEMTISTKSHAQILKERKEKEIERKRQAGEFVKETKPQTVKKPVPIVKTNEKPMLHGYNGR